MLESLSDKVAGLQVYRKETPDWRFPLHVRKYISELVLLIVLLVQQIICFRMSLYNYKEN